jgi:predicted metal-dependent hydrolase
MQRTQLTKPQTQTRTETELRNLIHTLAQNYQRELNAQINKIYFKKMKTKWASHSQNNNLTINTLLKYLPQTQIEYVTYHELAHAKQGRKHDENFWNLINRKFKNYQTLENDLLTYWFLIQQNLRKPETVKRF